MLAIGFIEVFAGQVGLRAAAVEGDGGAVFLHSVIPFGEQV